VTVPAPSSYTGARVPLAGVAARLPTGWGSVRARLSLLYSAVVFGLGAVLVSLVYIGVSEYLRKQPVTETVMIPGEPLCMRMGNVVLCGGNSASREVEQVDQVKLFEKAINQRALERFRLYSFAGLGGLFLVSIVVGWVLSGRVLRPIHRITMVASVWPGTAARRTCRNASTSTDPTTS
jgi:hypothetical protein